MTRLTASMSTQIAPPQLRGALNIMFQLSVTIGILAAQLINYGAEPGPILWCHCTLYISTMTKLVGTTPSRLVLVIKGCDKLKGDRADRCFKCKQNIGIPSNLTGSSVCIAAWTCVSADRQYRSLGSFHSKILAWLSVACL